ncbi:MAG TPA: IS1634 family transposase [Nocardioidaceae bacterium]|nr:IS1634 family transposase [Nocardioidaceae bacterium]
MASISRFLSPAQAGAAAQPRSGAGVEILDVRPMGGAYVLDGWWQRLGIPATLSRLLAGRRVDSRSERVLFAMVANRALEPLAKLAGAKWVTERVAVAGLAVVDEDTCYRAMDWLLEIEADLAEAAYWSVADLLNLEVDLLFFDTTSTYFETEQADDPEEGATVGFRTFGHSKDSRPDLPQVIIGMAVTRTGIPIRVWTWPGNTNDQALIRQVKDDLRAWKLGRVVWVADRGFTSAENRRSLQRAGGHDIIGEKIRGDNKEARAALSRQGRYHVVAGNLQVKEVVLDDGTMRDRFVICHNPDQADRDKTIRDQLLTQLVDTIADSDTLTATTRAGLAGERRGYPGLKRFLRVTAGGLLRVDQAAVRAEARLDGKFLLRTSDPTLSAEDVALGYKQLLEVERGWRDMKSTLALRPVYHHLERRIRAHVVLCWLALLLIRPAETATDDTWRNLRHQLDRMHQVTLAGDHGTIVQRNATTADRAGILRRLDLAEPPKFYEFNPT